MKKLLFSSLILIFLVLSVINTQALPEGLYTVDGSVLPFDRVLMNGTATYDIPNAQNLDIGIFGGQQFSLNQFYSTYNLDYDVDLFADGTTVSAEIFDFVHSSHNASGILELPTDSAIAHPPGTFFYDDGLMGSGAITTGYAFMDGPESVRGVNFDFNFVSAGGNGFMYYVPETPIPSSYYLNLGIRLNDVVTAENNQLQIGLCETETTSGSGVCVGTSAQAAYINFRTDAGLSWWELTNNLIFDSNATVLYIQQQLSSIGEDNTLDSDVASILFDIGALDGTPSANWNLNFDIFELSFTPAKWELGHGPLSISGDPLTFNITDTAAVPTEFTKSLYTSLIDTSIVSIADAIVNIWRDFEPTSATVSNTLVKYTTTFTFTKGAAGDPWTDGIVFSTFDVRYVMSGTKIARYNKALYDGVDVFTFLNNEEKYDIITLDTGIAVNAAHSFYIEVKYDTNAGAIAAAGSSTIDTSLIDRVASWLDSFRLLLSSIAFFGFVGWLITLLVFRRNLMGVLILTTVAFALYLILTMISSNLIIVILTLVGLIILGAWLVKGMMKSSMMGGRSDRRSRTGRR